MKCLCTLIKRARLKTLVVRFWPTRRMFDTPELEKGDIGLLSFIL